MIVRDKPNAWQLLFVMKGSIIPTIAPRLAAVTLLSVLVVALQETGLIRVHEIAALPFSLIGIALSIFAGFRNSACYDRWWEGRKVFGQLLVEARSFARLQLAAREPAAGRRAVQGAIAFGHLLRHHLRGEAPGDEALAALGAAGLDGVAAARNPPNMLLAGLTREAVAAAREGALGPQVLQVLEERLVALSGILAAAERIRAMPVPYTYSLMLHRTAMLFCLLLPFGLAAAAGAWTPLLVLIVSYTFFGLDALGDELENPFGSGQNALPLSAMTRGLEIDLREMLGEAELPEPLRPVDYLLR